jgi:hypothetical protein
MRPSHLLFPHLGSLHETSLSALVRRMGRLPGLAAAHPAGGGDSGRSGPAVPATDIG